jgi:hypothetical protein
MSRRIKWISVRSTLTLVGNRLIVASGRDGKEKGWMGMNGIYKVAYGGRGKREDTHGHAFDDTSDT